MKSNPSLQNRDLPIWVHPEIDLKTIFFLNMFSVLAVCVFIWTVRSSLCYTWGSKSEETVSHKAETKSLLSILLSMKIWEHHHSTKCETPRNFCINVSPHKPKSFLQHILTCRALAKTSITEEKVRQIPESESHRQDETQKVWRCLPKYHSNFPKFFHFLERFVVTVAIVRLRLTKE